MTRNSPRLTLTMQTRLEGARYDDYDDCFSLVKYFITSSSWNTFKEFFTIQLYARLQNLVLPRKYFCRQDYIRLLMYFIFINEIILDRSIRNLRFYNIDII